ncbi:MAG: hypothetical protein QOJ12_2051 [Thermoleophilales bacterium]|jgi:hypothetical protein|nr:hypothetical protein [Thermoleophilales bacterium]
MAPTETESGGRLPQPTEEIHLPDPSYLPVLVALGTAIIVTGVVLSWYIVGLGAVITLVALFKWIKLARREMRELPLEH